MTPDPDERLRQLEVELADVRRENALRLTALESELAAIRAERAPLGSHESTVAPARDEVAAPLQQWPPVWVPPPPTPPVPRAPRSPQPPRPASQPTPVVAPAKKDGPPIWERLAGPRGIAVGGGFVLLLGIVFLFAIATQRGWVTPAMRCGIGAIASFGSLAAAVLIRRRFGLEDAAKIAVGVGFSGLYASLGAGAVLFDLIPLGIALAGVIAIATAAVVTAIRWKSELVAAFGLTAALVAGPIATGSLDADAVLLSVSILAAGAAVCLKERWRNLLVVSIVLVGAQAVILGINRLADESDHTHLVWVVLPAAAVILLVTGIVLRLRDGAEPADRQLGLVMMMASFPATLFAFAAAADLPDGHELLYGLVLIPPAIVFLALGAWLTVQKRDAVMQAALLGAGFGLVAVLSASALGGSSLTLVFAVEAAVSAVVSARARDARFLVPAGAYLVAGAAHALAIDVPVAWFNEWHGSLAARAWVFFPLAGAALVCAAAVRRADIRLPRVTWLRDVEQVLANVPVALELAAAAAAIWGTSLYLLVAGHARLGGADAELLVLDRAHVAVSALWVTLGVVLYLGIRLPDWRWAGQGLLVATAAKVSFLDSDLRSWRWIISAGVLGAGCLLAGIVDSLRRPGLRWRTADAVDLSVAAVTGLIVAFGLPEHWAPAPVPWQLLAAGTLAWLLLTALIARTGQRSVTTIAWAAAAIYAFAGLTDGLADHEQTLVIAYTGCSAAMLLASRLRREPRAVVGSAGFAIAALVVCLAAVAQPDDFVSSTSSPASGLASVLGLVLLGTLFAKVRAYDQRPDGDDLDRAFAENARGWTLAGATVAATLALYAIALTILGLAQLLPGDVDTNFQRGHAVVSGVWAISGLVVLFLSLYRESRGLRIGALIVLAVSVAKLFVFDLAQLSSLARAFSFIGVGVVLLAAGLAYARLASDLKQHDSK